jgi:hypothetical protein
MWWKYYVFMYANGKMRPVETIPGMQGKVDKAIEGGSEFAYDYCMNFGKCQNVPQVHP